MGGRLAFHDLALCGHGWWALFFAPLWPPQCKATHGPEATALFSPPPIPLAHSHIFPGPPSPPPPSLSPSPPFLLRLQSRKCAVFMGLGYIPSPPWTIVHPPLSRFRPSFMGLCPRYALLRACLWQSKVFATGPTLGHGRVNSVQMASGGHTGSPNAANDREWGRWPMSDPLICARLRAPGSALERLHHLVLRAASS